MIVVGDDYILEGKGAYGLPCQQKGLSGIGAIFYGAHLAPEAQSAGSFISATVKILESDPTLVTNTYVVHSLEVLGSIVDVYRHLGEATISIATTKMKLFDVNSMPETNGALTFGTSPTPRGDIMEAFKPFELDLASSFACIAMLELGSINMSVESVMVISSGNSLYNIRCHLHDI